MEGNEHTYVPGSCNIGAAEIQRRKRIGFIGLGIAFLIFLILEIIDAPKPYRFLIFPPVFYSLSGFIQARHRFCYIYGWRGVFSMSGRKQFHSIAEKAAHRKDVWTAVKIISLVTLGSIFITLWYYVI